jgi:hypothetical protein
MSIRVNAKSRPSADGEMIDVAVIFGGDGKRTNLIEALRAAGYLALVTGEPDDLAIGSAIAWLLLNLMAEPKRFEPVVKPRRRAA